MKKLWLLVFIMCVGMISTVLAAPKIEVNEKEWDFGIVGQKANLRHSYWVKNVGDSTLNIIKVKPG
jgi:hypothetical protein